jgi:hypothetical protein
MNTWKWVYVDSDGVEHGWFSDAERAEMDSVRTSGADYHWRRLTKEETRSFSAYLGRLAYEQS